MPIYKTNKKKDGKQQYRVFVCYTDAEGKQKRKTKCIYGLTEAKEVERDLADKIKESASSMTVKQLYEEYKEKFEKAGRPKDAEKLYIMAGDYDGAITAYSEFLKAYPNSA